MTPLWRTSTTNPKCRKWAAPACDTPDLSWVAAGLGFARIDRFPTSHWGSGGSGHWGRRIWFEGPSPPREPETPLQLDMSQYRLDRKSADRVVVKSPCCLAIDG